MQTIDLDRQAFEEFLSDEDSGECSGVEITDVSGEKKAITAVIAVFDLDGDVVRRDLYAAMREAIVETKRASKIATDALRKLAACRVQRA